MRWYLAELRPKQRRRLRDPPRTKARIHARRSGDEVPTCANKSAREGAPGADDSLRAAAPVGNSSDADEQDTAEGEPGAAYRRIAHVQQHTCHYRLTRANSRCI